MVFAIQNKTESTYSFDMKSFSLNNFMMPEYNSQFEITSGENGTYTQKIKFDTLSSVYGIKKVVSIKFDYTIAGSENSGLITMGSVSVSNGKEQAAQEIDDLKTDYLIASDRITSYNVCYTKLLRWHFRCIFLHIGSCYRCWRGGFRHRSFGGGCCGWRFCKR